MKQLEKSLLIFDLNIFEMKFISYSLKNTNNITNFINPVNTFVTGEVIVERNEHNSSKFYLDFC